MVPEIVWRVLVVVGTFQHFYDFGDRLKGSVGSCYGFQGGSVVPVIL